MLEAASGFEPENGGFADLCLTTWLCRQVILERETGFEPATSTLARLHSTTELFPLTEKISILQSLVYCQGRFQSFLLLHRQLVMPDKSSSGFTLYFSLGYALGNDSLSHQSFGSFASG